MANGSVFKKPGKRLGKDFVSSTYFDLRTIRNELKLTAAERQAFDTVEALINKAYEEIIS